MDMMLDLIFQFILKLNGFEATALRKTLDSNKQKYGKFKQKKVESFQKNIKIHTNIIFKKKCL
jgi:hypothetical protein